MKRSKFTEEQIAFALRQAETGTRVFEVQYKRDVDSDVLEISFDELQKENQV